MKKRLLSFGAAALLAALARADEKPVYAAPAKPLKTEYPIYSGELGNEQAPTSNDRKLTIEGSGQAAKEILDSLYPDAKVSCSGVKGERLRRKGRMWCGYQPSDGSGVFSGSISERATAFLAGVAHVRMVIGPVFNARGLLPLPYASDQSEGSASYRPFKGDYVIYPASWATSRHRPEMTARPHSSLRANRRRKSSTLCSP